MSHGVVLRGSLLVLTLFAAGPARAQGPVYPWGPSPASEALDHRIAPPPGARRVPVEPGSFGAFLRALPLLPAGTPVHLFDGREKPSQAAQVAVVDLDVPRRDLQQCADAVMRLRAEYLYGRGRFADIVFHPDPGRPARIAYSRGRDRAAFGKYLIRLFADAGSASLEAELPRRQGPVRPGDVLIQGGHPGHAIAVLDVAVDDTGHRFLLLGQSYMPAQQLHVLRDPKRPDRGPWYDESDLDGSAGLMTPEWPRAFTRAQVRRFSE